LKAFKFIALFFLLCVGNGFSQSNFTMLENVNNYFGLKYQGQLNVYNHNSIRPFILPDSVSSLVFNQQYALCDKLFSKQYFNDNSDFKILALPLAGLNYEKHTGDSDTAISNLGIGFMFKSSFRNKLSFDADFSANKGTFSPFLLERVDSLNIMPGNGLRYNGTPQKIYYENWNAHLSYSPNKFINIQVGRGKNFWGYGYRSLFLSDNATSYPFAKFTTNFWRIKYVSMVAQMKDIRNANGDPSKFFNKFGTFHLLSWNITKRFNINIFESVIWQAKDTLQNRQLDINYLNPVIFFRPVEYSLGSSDNSILGLGAQFKINDAMSIYGQGLLDEFLLSQIKADSGWWANKYGLQIGFKAFEPFKLKGFYFQTEYNAVRPFTYSHGSIYQNFAHYNQPLAHPMGSNFRDWIIILEYRYKWLTISNRTIIGNYGTDTAGLNYGGNLYQSYSSRAQDYHNFIGQGLNNELFYNRTAVDLLICKQNNLRLELAYTLRNVKNSYSTSTTNFISIGIKANLYNSYNDF
jgi:hypothetical protein